MVWRREVSGCEYWWIHAVHFYYAANKNAFEADGDSDIVHIVIFLMTNHTET